MRQAGHRDEFTGNASLDRIQMNVRNLALEVRRIIDFVLRSGDGVVDIDMRDSTHVATPDEAAAKVLRIVGPLTNTQTLVLPTPASLRASYVRWVINDTTGAWNVLAAVPGSTTSANIPAGTIGAVLFSPDGARLLV